VNFLSRCQPQVRVHCWGGLGSQLHAWCLFEDLRTRYPSRKFKLVFHTSGITRRLPEIDGLLLLKDFIVVDDYESSDYFPSGKPNVSKILKKLLWQFLRSVFNTSKLVMVPDLYGNRIGLIRIKAWTFSVRGHYSQLRINLDCLDRLNLKLTSAFQETDLSLGNSLVVHLRLGDLIGLESKSPTPPETFQSIFGKALIKSEVQRVVLHSDSEVGFEEYFLGINPSLSLIRRENYSGVHALFEMVHSRIFLGTSSKLSVWAAIFRQVERKGDTYLPAHFRPILENLLGGRNLDGIKFYD
jgi:hypothetical protein